MGLHDNIYITFGKHFSKPVSRTPSSYLRWCLEQDWFETKHPTLVEPFEEELQWRDTWDQHFEDEREVRY